MDTLYHVLICSLLAFYSFTVCSGTSCLEGWKTHSGKCYLFKNDSTLPYDEADHFCLGFSANLASVNDEDTNTFLATNIQNREKYWLGLRPFDNYDWGWNDGSVDDNIPWGVEGRNPRWAVPWVDGEPKRGPACARIVNRHYYTAWDCDYRLRALCEVGHRPNVPVEWRLVSRSGQWYFSTPYKMTQPLAARMCSSYGGYLVRIGSRSERLFVAESFIQWYHLRFWVGLTRLHWTDGTGYNWNNWEGGRNYDDYQQGSSCVLFNGDSQKWRRSSCFAHRPFVCSYDSGNKEPTTSEYPPPTAVADQCGVPYFPPTFSRIVGGENARPHSYPWVISLRTRRRVDKFSPDGFGHWCGGSIISPQYILTAAHCVIHSKQPSDFIVRTGEHDQNITSPNEQDLDIERIIIHPDYDRHRESSDIAIIELAHPITYTQFVPPICLPTEDPQLGEKLTVVGWGSTQTNDARWRILQQVQVPFVSLEKCKEMLLYVTQSNICAGERGKDACSGDSGSPLMRVADGVYQVVGFVSWGIGCGDENYPGVYVRVSRYLQWLRQTTEYQRRSQNSPPRLQGDYRLLDLNLPGNV